MGWTLLAHISRISTNVSSNRNSYTPSSCDPRTWFDKWFHWREKKIGYRLKKATLLLLNDDESKCGHTLGMSSRAPWHHCKKWLRVCILKQLCFKIRFSSEYPQHMGWFQCSLLLDTKKWEAAYTSIVSKVTRQSSCQYRLRNGEILFKEISVYLLVEIKQQVTWLEMTVSIECI